jgi:hypothetical protein
MIRARLAMGASLIVAACAKPTAFISQLSIDELEGGEVVGFTEVELEERVSAELVKARFSVATKGHRAPEGVKGWIVKAAAGFEEPDLQADQGPRAMIVFHLRRQGSAEGFEVRVSRPSRLRSPDVKAIQDAVRQAFETALALAAREAKALVDLEPATDEVIAGRLRDSDEAIRAAAVRLLVTRRNPAAIPVLVERLKSPDLDVVRTAVGFLVELKAAGAVNPMIEATRGQGPLVEREIVFAVGAIGGEDAEAYLDLLASGHDDPVVRDSAEAALRELRANRGEDGGRP